MSWFFIVATLISLAIGIYLGFQLPFILNLQKSTLFKKHKIIYWVVIIFSSLSFILTRIFSTPIFTLIANYIFALILCALFITILFDLCILIYRLINKTKPRSNYIFSSVFLFLVFITYSTGLYMATQPRIINYQINIPKPASVEQLRVVQVSDIHIDENTSTSTIENMVEKINRLNPDLVVVTGDTLDMRLKPFVDKNLAAIFAKLTPKYGTYIIFGNHEHYGAIRNDNNTEHDIISAFEAGNMIALKDEMIYLDKLGIYLIGRDDYVLANLDRERATLSSLFDNVNTDKPILVLDHQPRDLDNSSALGVDIMYSGHTHAGQIFPMNILVQFMYKNAWGLYQNDNAHGKFTSIVSSGYGLWGPPIRLFTRSEIVVTDLTFNKQ